LDDDVTLGVTTLASQLADQSQAPAPESSGRTEASTTEERSITFGHTIWTGLLVTVLILVVKLGFEHTTFYRSYQTATYNWLQSWLQPPHTRADLPVVVLDISKLESDVVEVKGTKFTVTPREKLLPLIQAVAAQSPSAIGVDIDFAPNQFGLLDPQRDQPFFRSLLKIKETIPIFLGIGRTHGDHPRFWLSLPEFESLAADIVVPEDERKMFRWVETAPDPKSGQSGRGRSLSAALAEAYTQREQERRGWFAWAWTKDSIEQIEPYLKANEFLVDYSPVQTLQDMRVTTIEPLVVADFEWTLKDKVVLIGDGVTFDTRDTFPIPTLTHRRGVPGIYKHAAAVYTLIKAPLYELTGYGRILVDLFLSLMVLVPLAFLRRIISRRTNNRLAEESTIGLLIILVTVFAVVVGVVFVHYTRTIWDDFIFVIIALWIHRPVAHGLHWLYSASKEWPRQFLNVLSRPNERGQQ
jgi:CHASE2 domain-containing sensor protein